MTNKLTVPSELIHRAIDAIEQVGYQDKFIDYTFVRAVKQELRAALADPVPPTGGKPDPIIAVLKGHLADGMNPMFSGGDIKHLIGLLEAGTRLQAEVERLGKRVEEEVATAISNDLKSEREVLALQSELTKARNALLKIVHASEWTRDDAHYASEAQTIAVNAISNQSAPADKGGDDWHMNPCKQGHRDVGAAGGVAHCYTCDEKIEAATTQEAYERWNAAHPAEQPESADKGQGDPLAFPGYPPVPEDRKLPFGQPAPVAVSLPERKTVKAGLLSESNTHNQGWNACLDEFARLNSEPKP